MSSHTKLPDSIRSRSRGVSIVEALVAMAVMAFGMLAMVGVQTTFRVSADIAKQRTEATRIAEEEMERLRTFRDVPAISGAALGWDEIGDRLGVVISSANSNATYTLNRKVVNVAGSAQKSVSVQVSWIDRLGGTQIVNLGDVIAGAAPVLSGLLSVVATHTSTSQRSNRHRTIPGRAGNLGNGESVFKPREGGVVAWKFNNTTGVISHVCTVLNSSTSSALTVADLSSCSSTPAQLLSGTVRFNLRGVSLDLGDGSSAYKPIPGGTVAWVIDNATQRIVRSCTVSAALSTTSLLASHVTGAGCSNLSVPQAIAPFDAVNDPSYGLLAIDSEDPRWPVLAFTVGISLASSGHASSPLCFAGGASLASSALFQYNLEYYCIIYNNSTKYWDGITSLIPSGFTDAGAVAWTAGITVDTYRICRYSSVAENASASITASNDVRVNINHPRDYYNVRGNLINQNFLVVYGPKACPTDVAANPAAGDYVNSNTWQHQP